MELTRYWQFLRRWWWLLLAGSVVAAGVGLIGSILTPPTYRSTMRLLVNQVQSPGTTGYNDILTSERLAKTYSELLRSQPVAEETIRQLGLPLTSSQLLARTSVRVVRETQLLELAVEDPDPARSAVIANRMAQIFIERTEQLQAGKAQEAQQQIDRGLADAQQMVADATVRLTQARAANADQAVLQRLQGELSQYQDTYLKLLETQQRMVIAQTQAQSSVSVAVPATTATKVRPQPVRNTLLAAIFGLLLVGSLATLITYLDDRIHDPEEVRQLLGVAPLARLHYAKAGKGRAGAGPLLIDSTAGGVDQLTEAMRLLRTNLDFVTMGGRKVICISSATPGEGKSTVSANLAIAEALAGRRVILVDCDLRKPDVHNVLGLSSEQGLSTFLAQTIARQEPATQEGLHGVEVLTAGPIPPNPTELLGSARMAELLDRLRQRADVVILDTAPIQHLADTRVLLPHIDGIVLVIDVQRTGLKVLRRVLASLEQSSGKVLGLVLNKERSRGDIYGYGYGYGRKGGAASGAMGGGGDAPAPSPVPLNARMKGVGPQLGPGEEA